MREHLTFPRRRFVRAFTSSRQSYEGSDAATPIARTPESTADLVD